MTNDEKYAIVNDRLQTLAANLMVQGDEDHAVVSDAVQLLDEWRETLKNIAILDQDIRPAPEEQCRPYRWRSRSEKQEEWARDALHGQPTT